MTTWLDKLKNKLTTPELKNGTYTLSSDNNVVLFENDVEIGRGTKITFNHNGGELVVIPLGTVTQMQLEKGDTVSDWKLAWEDLSDAQKPARLIEGSGTFTYTGSESLDSYTTIIEALTQNGATLNGKPLVNGLNKIENNGIVKIELQGDDLIFANPQIRNYYAQSFGAQSFGAQSITTGTIFNPITKIRMYYDDESAFEYGDDSGSILEIDSKFATPETVEYVHGLLNGYEYVPVDAKGVYIDPAIERGDMVGYGDINGLVANTKWTFDGLVTADIETPLDNEDNYDEPYNTLIQQQFKRKVSLGDSYQGVTIDRQKGLEMLLSPTGKEDEALGKAYFDLHRGMAFQYRDTPRETWKDWLYFDKDEKTFRISMYDDMIEDIELYETYFAYSPNADGVPMYEEWSEDRVYIGFASAKERPTEPSAYQWSRLQGEPGADGRSVTNQEQEFYLSNSKTTQTGGSWQTTRPQWEIGKYLWTRIKFTFNKSPTTEYTTPMLDSSWEAIDSVGLKTISKEFYLSTSKTTQTGGSWQSTLMQGEKNKYIWIRDKYVFEDNSVKYSTPYRDEVYTDFAILSDEAYLQIGSNGELGMFHLGRDDQGSPVGTIAAKHIKIDGNVTFASGYDPSSKATPGDITTAINNLNLGDVAFKDKIGTAMLDETVIVGGYIKTSLISFDDAVGENVNLTGYIKATDGEFVGNLKAGMIGGLTIDNDGILLPNEKIRINSSDNSLDFGGMKMKYENVASHHYDDSGNTITTYHDELVFETGTGGEIKFVASNPYPGGQLPDSICVEGVAANYIFPKDKNEIIMGGFEGVAPVCFTGGYYTDSIKTYKPFLRLSGNFVDYYADDESKRITAFRDGNTVHLVGALEPMTNNTLSEMVTNTRVYGSFTLPKGFRPQYGTIYALCQGSGNAQWLASLDTDGKFYVSRYRGGTPNFSTWLPFSITYTTRDEYPVY